MLTRARSLLLRARSLVDVVDAAGGVAPAVETLRHVIAARAAEAPSIVTMELPRFALWLRQELAALQDRNIDVEDELARLKVRPVTINPARIPDSQWKDRVLEADRQRDIARSAQAALAGALATSEAALDHVKCERDEATARADALSAVAFKAKAAAFKVADVPAFAPDGNEILCLCGHPAVDHTLTHEDDVPGLMAGCSECDCECFERACPHVCADHGTACAYSINDDGSHFDAEEMPHTCGLVECGHAGSVLAEAVAAVTTTTTPPRLKRSTESEARKSAQEMARFKARETAQAALPLTPTATIPDGSSKAKRRDEHNAALAVRCPVCMCAVGDACERDGALCGERYAAGRVVTPSHPGIMAALDDVEKLEIETTKKLTPESVRCPKCDAIPGSKCLNWKGKGMAAHSERQARATMRAGWHRTGSKSLAERNAEARR